MEVSCPKHLTLRSMTVSCSIHYSKRRFGREGGWGGGGGGGGGGGWGGWGGGVHIGIWAKRHISSTYNQACFIVCLLMIRALDGFLKQIIYIQILSVLIDINVPCYGSPPSKPEIQNRDIRFVLDDHT